jgi:hypothetical protein
MKQFIKISLIAAVIFCNPFTTSAQYEKEETPGGVFVNASVGMSFKTEIVYEFELGAKPEGMNLYISVPGMVYVAKTANDKRPHFYYGIRATYLFKLSDLAALGPMGSYLRHITGEAGRDQSNDWDAGIRFYKFVSNPGAKSAAWSVTARYLHTMSNVYNTKGERFFEPGNRYIISVGIHGLF